MQEFFVRLGAKITGKLANPPALLPQDGIDTPPVEGETNASDDEYWEEENLEIVEDLAAATAFLSDTINNLQTKHKYNSNDNLTKEPKPQSTPLIPITSSNVLNNMQTPTFPNAVTQCSSITYTIASHDSSPQLFSSSQLSSSPPLSSAPQLSSILPFPSLPLSSPLLSSPPLIPYTIAPIHSSSLQPSSPVTAITTTQPTATITTETEMPATKSTTTTTKATKVTKVTKATKATKATTKANSCNKQSQLQSSKRKSNANKPANNSTPPSPVKKSAKKSQKPTGKENVPPS